MDSTADTKGIAYFLQHLPVQQGLSSSYVPLDAFVHPRGPFGERERTHLSLHEGDPRPLSSFSYVLGNRNEETTGGPPVPNAGFCSSIVQTVEPLFAGAMQRCMTIGSCIRVWLQAS